MQKILIILFLFGVTSTFAQNESGLLYDLSDTAFVNPPPDKSTLTLKDTCSWKAYCPKSEDQGTTPTCVSWALTYAWTIQKRILAKDLNLGKPDKKQLFSPYYLAYYAHRPNKYDAAVRIFTAVKQFEAKGTILRTHPTFTTDFRKPPKDTIAALENKIQGFDFIYDRAKYNPQGIKNIP
jgi:hypothetical protein